MVKSITPQVVEKFVKGSITKANTVYCNLSGGEWVTGRGVESFLAYFIAQPFAKFLSLRNVSILLEVGQKEFENNYIGQSKLSKEFNSRGRFDVVLVRKDGLDRHAIGVIELKREDPDAYPGGYEKGIKRLASTVNACRTSRGFRFGCFAGIVREKKGEDRIKRLRSRWEPFIKQVAKQKALRARLFTSLDRHFESDEYKHNGRVCRDRARYDIIGCVFSR